MADAYAALVADLEAAGPELHRRAPLVVEKTGYDVVGDAQVFVPVDTGYLKSTIGVDFDADGLGFEAGPTAKYGGYVEFGTSRMSPQPYMIPAFEQRLPAAEQALGQLGIDVLRER